MSKKNKKKSENLKEEVAMPEEINPAEAESLTEEVTEDATNETAGEVNGELSELDKALAAAEDFKRKWYNVTAEYENYRKRNAAAVSNAYRDGEADAVLKLLPVADSFGYALDSAQDEKTRAGIDKVMKSFATILQSLGIEEIELKPGDPFDETVAEAIMNSPCEEGDKPNTIKLILKKGYKSGDKVIRYAQVTVTV